MVQVLGTSNRRHATRVRELLILSERAPRALRAVGTRSA